MQWVLIRNENGMYVTKPGGHNSYTKSLKHAQRFPTKEAALADACGNERAIPDTPTWVARMERRP